MAAPSGIVWGSIVGDYGRIGIYTSLSNTETVTTVNVQLWFWSKYSVTDSYSATYYNVFSSPGIPTTIYENEKIITGVATGGAWPTANQILLKTFTHSYTRETGAVTKYAAALLANVDRVGGTMGANATFTIPALTSYKISYNANGGSGAPSAQTKYYGKTLTLSSTKPTREGYTFQGWAITTGGSVMYHAGGSYSSNAAMTLHAVWKANTYTVQYNANGGTGAPGAQTKTHGVTLKLSSTKPTRTGYDFKGWGVSASSTTVSYASGANYTGNAALTLYAIWERSYIKPRIYNLTAERCDADGTMNESGENALVKFGWETTEESPTIDIYISGPSGGTESFAGSGTSGNVNKVCGPIGAESSYQIEVLIDDGYGSTSASATLSSITFPIDVKSGGEGIAFGKTAELNGVAEFAYEGKFNKPVYGKALGMDRLPAIPENSDFNEYMEPGCYAVRSNAIAATVLNCPCDRAGRLEVWSATGEGVRLEQWSYLRQRYIPYNSVNAVWEREITRNADNVWTYYDWWRSSLTPAASEKIYNKAALTASRANELNLSTVNVYTKIPLTNTVISTSDRLTMTSRDDADGAGAVKIGSGISYVKVNGQALIKCGSVSGNRHLRLQKVSGSTTTSVAWTCVYATAQSNTLFPIATTIVPVKEGDLLKIVCYTGDTGDSIQSGSSANGWQTYLTVEEL